MSQISAPLDAATPLVPNHAHGRSLKDFHELTWAERRLIETCRKGKVYVLGTGRPKHRSSNNGIRAGLVRFLALGGDEFAPVHEKGIQLKGAWLDGVLDLGDCDVVRPIILLKCRLEGVKTDDARLPGLFLDGSCLEQGLAGNRMSCSGVLSLRDGFTARKAVSLQSAEIGRLDCVNGQFDGSSSKDRRALDLSGATLHGPAWFSGKFQAAGAVVLSGADLGGILDCSGGRFANAEGDALNCDGLKVAGGMSLSNGFRASGAVRLSRTDIGGILDCSGGRFANAEGDALACNGVKVAGGMLLSGEFHATGKVSLLRQHRRRTSIAAADSSNPKGQAMLNVGPIAFDFSHAEIGGNVFLGRPSGEKKDGTPYRGLKAREQSA